MKKRVLVVLLLGVCMPLSSQTDYKRSRGEGLYKCESANTVGSGDVWVHLRVLGFLWDADPEAEGRPKPYPFAEAKLCGGLFNIAELSLESRALSYIWDQKPQFGSIVAGAKVTTPNNEDIRFHGFGLEIKYQHNFVKAFSSIAGFRNEGTGFYPEGFAVAGGTMTISALYDLDLIAKLSWLPVKMYANTGARIPFNKEYVDYSQYLIYLGAAYVGLGADVFIEYSIEAFGNTSTDPKKFSFAWPGWGGSAKTWEVAFPENPMYLTIGGRVRYPSGLVLYGAVPLLLSQNVGSAMTDEDRKALSDSKNNPNGKFYDEWLRGVTDPFDPWYAKWKIILQASFPFFYKMTGAEMRRNFLLLKNRRDKKKIDIDKRIDLQQGESEQDNEADRKKRLEEIKKRREEIENKE